MANDSTESIGKRVELEKTRLDLKNSEVCSALDIHLSTYRNYETGKRDMPISLLVKLWEMGFDPMYILTGNTLRELQAQQISTDASSNVSSDLNQRLIPSINSDSSNFLLDKMIHVEDAFQIAGAKGGEDYTYKDLVQIALVTADKPNTI